MKKVMGGLIIALALVIGIVPQFTDCLSQGLALTTANGMQVPMKCHWTAIAEIGVAVPLALVGIANFISKRKETFRAMGVFGAALGTLAILFPTVLIGVCANPTHFCNMVERPTLILAGTLAIAASVVTLVNSQRMMDMELAA
jgi:hypothetical protein